MRKYIYIALVCFLFSYCKKTEDVTPPSISPIYTGPIDGRYVITQNINSIVPSTTNTSVLQVSYQFYNPPVGQRTLFVYPVDVGTVSVNSIILKKKTNSNLNEYIDTTNNLSTPPLTVSISGSPSFAPTTFTDSGSHFAGFSNINSIPNSISKSAGFTFTLSNLINQSFTEVRIDTVYASFTGNVINITPSHLSGLNTSNTYTLSIKCGMGVERPILLNGKYFGSEYVLNYTKQGIIVTP